LDVLPYLMLGLATSLHCVAMCGSLVLTFAVKDTPEGGALAPRLVPHLAYQAAKITSYATVALVLGGVAAAAGGALDISGFRSWIMVVAGVYMVLLGLGMTGWFPVLQRLSPRPPQALVKAMSKVRRKSATAPTGGAAGLAMPVAFGLLTGLMPCAPLIAAQAGAMTSGSPLTGAALMVAFGVGTAPLMLVFGLASSFASGALRRRMGYVAAIAVLVFGLVFLDRGLTLVGSPVTFASVRQAVVGTGSGGGSGSATPSWREVGGVAEVDLVIENTRFVPDVISLPADRPVRLVVDRREDAGCSAQLAVPQFGVLADLAPFAKTVVELPAMPAGSYTLTCGMGMLSGRLEVASGP
jgi:sulfite exporter TauE/SafE